MAAKRKPRPAVAPPSPQPMTEVRYIVNPAGAIHSVDEAHFHWRLTFSGWREATPGEIAAYQQAPSQQFSHPIGKRGLE